jgi:hypothetical protein
MEEKIAVFGEHVNGGLRGVNGYNSCDFESHPGKGVSGMEELSGR